MYNIDRQWTFIADMNGDYAVTISDAWLWLKWLFFYPGDLFMYFIMSSMPRVAQFFEMSFESYGGIVSGAISFFAWFIVFGIAASLDEASKSGPATK